MGRQSHLALEPGSWEAALARCHWHVQAVVCRVVAVMMPLGNASNVKSGGEGEWGQVDKQLHIRYAWPARCRWKPEPKIVNSLPDRVVNVLHLLWQANISQRSNAPGRPIGQAKFNRGGPKKGCRHPKSHWWTLLAQPVNS